MISISNKQYWLIEQYNLNPGRTAFISKEKTVLYERLAVLAIKAADKFSKSGIKKNSRVAILTNRASDFFIAVNALWFLGAVPVPINPKLTNEEIEKQLSRIDAEFILAGPGSPKFSSTRVIKNISFSILDESSKIDENFDPALFTSIYSAEINLSDNALIMFTSGSTGEAKGVVHTFKSLLESVIATDSFSELSSNDRWLASLPFYHIGGFMILVRALITGSSVIFPDEQNYEGIKDTIGYFSPTHISLVPTMLQRMLNENQNFNKSLKIIYLGGGPSSESVSIKSAELGLPVVKVYGSTETCSMATALHPADLKTHPGSSGKVIGRNRIKIIDEEIYVSSASLFKEYFNDRIATEEKVKDGWFRTGDYGRIDSGEYLFVESRREDIIITGGENVSALEVEEAIKQFAGIKDAFVFPLQDTVWGQIVCAAIVADNFMEEELKTFLRSKLGAFKIPKKFFVVESIPKNEMGKINRAKLLSALKSD